MIQNFFLLFLFTVKNAHNGQLFILIMSINIRYSEVTWRACKGHVLYDDCTLDSFSLSISSCWMEIMTWWRMYPPFRLELRPLPGLISSYPWLWLVSNMEASCGFRSLKKKEEWYVTLFLLALFTSLVYVSWSTSFATILLPLTNGIWDQTKREGWT